MNARQPPLLHAFRGASAAVAADTDDIDDGDPNSFIACLKQISDGAAADGQPWPERHQLPGRRLALADTDGALTGLRVVQEVLLAAERSRQNAGPEHHVGDRVMEGLMLACLGLCAQASTRLRPG
ncbi:TPA: hypothetical protein QDZ75_000893 [Stenotrophomonas maltophilia]|nr:hypothetical protein [Stenotrophomonas maltophilia]